MQDWMPSIEGGFNEDEFDFDAELIKQNHLEVALLSKRGVKVKKPMWDGLVAS